MVLAAEAERQRIGVFLVADRNVQHGRIAVGVENPDVELVVGAPEHILQIDGEFPLRNGAEADAPRQRRRQGQFGLHDGRREFGGVETQLGQELADCLSDLGVVDHTQVDRTRIHLHFEFRTVGEAQRPLFVDVPHHAEVDADGHLGFAFEAQRHQIFVPGHFEEVGHLRIEHLQCAHERLVLCVVRTDRQQRTRKVEFTPRHHQTAADGEVLAEFERDGRLDVVCLEIDRLHELRSRPVVAPVHRGAERRVEGQTDRHPVEGFVVEVGVKRSGYAVVRGVVLRFGLARIVGERRIGSLRSDTRDADRNVELGVLKRSGGGVEPDRFGVEFHGCTHMAHTVLLRGEVVHLISFGVCSGGGGSGGQK